MKNLITLIVLTFFFACENKDKAVPINYIEVKNFSIEDVFSNPNGFKGLDTLTDWDYIYNEVKDNVRDQKKGFESRLTSYKEGIISQLAFSSIDSLENFVYRKAGTYSEKNEYHLLIEIASDYGFELFDLKLDTVQNLVKDIYVYGVGQSLIDIFISQEHFSTSEFQNNIGWYDLAMNAYDSGEYETAWEYIDMLPYEFRYEFPLRNLVYRLSELDDQLILDLIDEYEDIALQNKYISFISLKAGVLLERPEMIIDNAIVLSEKFSNSMLLKSFIGYAYELDNNYEKAKSKYEQVLALEPDHIWGYLDMIELLIITKEEAKVIALMKECDRKFNTSLTYWENLFNEPIILNKYKSSL